MSRREQVTRLTAAIVWCVMGVLLWSAPDSFARSYRAWFADLPYGIELWGALTVVVGLLLGAPAMYRAGHAARRSGPYLGAIVAAGWSWGAVYLDYARNLSGFWGWIGLWLITAVAVWPRHREEPAWRQLWEDPWDRR